MTSLTSGGTPQGHTVTYALTGACGGFARTLLAPARGARAVRPTVLCDRDVEGVHALAADLGYPADQLVTAADPETVRATVQAGRIAVVADLDLLAGAEYDILVEATGNPAAGYRAARQALLDGRHVAMVSKEVDSVAGVELARLATEHGVVYTPAEGDQPANLIRWYERLAALGLEIVALGKSSEYDLVYDPEQGTVTQLDTTLPAPELAGLLRLGEDPRATLAARAAAVSGLTRSAAADHCEMAVVASATGFTADRPELHYPVARVAELADVYAHREHGGIRTRDRVLDVFSVLRLPDEASFAGGVFAVVRTHDPATWELLRAKGHVVSRDGRYGCLYLPYHAMGLETPGTLVDAVRHGVGASPRPPRQHAVLAGRAETDLAAGTELTLYGHHHQVAGVAPALCDTDAVPADVAPFYLAAGTRLARHVPAGTLLTLDDLEGADPALLAAWQAGLAVPRG
ncbi:homoserine dehydrogenase [Streptomyces sp. DSM 44915]|uniref:Homoserine dehydrogenase n=1 Tax=Streptomyces chisholmiae TaxID=3075540 RepID=A0ABU2JQM0_9ACTN|nr:homoserine dehydrogenase [Streptomyces sp. DSM 44915]MDT0267286.1 homoserine dehydrogenase [Streptomyces sp. DSM 44915]